MRKTKIICTIGPASQGEEKLREVMLAGMNVARFNFSHGDHEEQMGKLKNILKVSSELQLPIATLLDTKGPEIRLRDFEEHKIMLEAGQTFTLTTDEVLGTKEKAAVSYKNITNDVTVGSKILIDDGKVEMVVEKIEGNDIVCRVLNDGPVGDKKGVNLPGANLSMPFISEADKKDIIFCAENGFDFLAASFTRTKEDVLAVRALLDEHNSKAKIIAKIENMQGIKNIDEIIEVADGIMVARGDMGVEIPMEDVPVLQKEIIKKTVAKGKPVITATQMLESMTHNPRPTRAEAADVANAIYDGTTAIMLSGETANGDYPVEAVKTMARIAERTEQDINYKNRLKQMDVTKNGELDVTTAISHATCTTAMDVNAAAIITVTMSGFTANMISRYKPDCQIVGCSVEPRVCRQMNLSWGVQPILIEKENDAEALFTAAAKAAKEAGIVKAGDTVVLTAGLPLGVTGKTNMLRVIEIE